MKELKIVYKNIDDVIPYDNNPRNNENAVDYVANSIKEFGFKVPIIIDHDNVIVTGHTRVKAAKKLGMTEVPCILADDLTEEQIKAFRLADNKVSEYSTWDLGKLDLEMQDLIDINMEDFGFEGIDTSVSYIDDLMENTYNDKNTTPEYFGFTLTIKKEFEEMVMNFVRENGKDVLIQNMIDFIRKGSD